MCLIAFAWRQHPRYPLLLAGNRDEFHGRPTAPLARWPQAPQIIAGRDLQAGGSWLGVSERGRLAAVTNIRLPAEQGPGLRSRGHLVNGFLEGTESAVDAGMRLSPQLSDYGPCNLLMFDTQSAVYARNHPEPQWRALTPALYGLSNAALDSPWPKTLALKAALQHWIDRPAEDFEALFAALANEHRPVDADLPDTVVGLERERFVSPAFIRGAEYGTRCSTVIAVTAEGDGVIEERRFGAGGIALGESRQVFAWPALDTAAM